MQRVIVTVQRGSEGRPRDLEVPAEVESRRLAELIVRALRWEDEEASPRVGYEIHAYPPGRVLDPRESLASAGVWDGSWLVLWPAGGAPMAGREGAAFGAWPAPGTPGSAPRPGPAAGPISGWQPLGIEIPSGPRSGAPGEPRSASRFAWKQLDTEPEAREGS